MEDAASEVSRALDMIEVACSIQSFSSGSHLISESTSTHTTPEPLVSVQVYIHVARNNPQIGRVPLRLTVQLPSIDRTLVNAFCHHDR